DPDDIAESEITDAERPHFPIEKDHSPRHRARILPTVRCDTRLDMRQLGRGYPGVTLGPVSRDPIPDEGGDHSHDRAEPERSAPAIARDDPGEQGRGERRTRSDARENPAIRLAPLVQRNPTRYKLIGARIHRRLTHPESKAHENEPEERVARLRRDDSRHGSEHPPADHARSQHTAGPGPGRKPPARNLTDRISEQERTENPSELHFAQLIVVRESHSGDRDVGPIQKSDRAQQEQPEDQEVPHRIGRRESIAGGGLLSIYDIVYDLRGDGLRIEAKGAGVSDRQGFLALILSVTSSCVAAVPLSQRIGHTDPARYRQLQAVHDGAGSM